MPEIKRKELARVINGMKKGKAPGQDGFGNEVLMYREVRIREKLQRVLNEI